MDLMCSRYHQHVNQNLQNVVVIIRGLVSMGSIEIETCGFKLRKKGLVNLLVWIRWVPQPINSKLQNVKINIRGLLRMGLTGFTSGD